MNYQIDQTRSISTKNFQNRQNRLKYKKSWWNSNLHLAWMGHKMVKIPQNVSVAFFATLFLKRVFFSKLSGPFWNPRLPWGQSRWGPYCRIFHFKWKSYTLWKWFTKWHYKSTKPKKYLKENGTFFWYWHAVSNRCLLWRASVGKSFNYRVTLKFKIIIERLRFVCNSSNILINHVKLIK